MDCGIQIGEVTPRHRKALVRMYGRFDPLGAAFGLPPRSPEARRAWICEALTHATNVAAFDAKGAIVGHCFLAPDGPDSAELAVFVRQEHRRCGIGSALLRAALERASASGLRRVWTMTALDNQASLRLQESCGFRIAKAAVATVEMEIVCEAPQPALALTQS
jgi:RimJ/RimL family protein N-acetyltransferase